MSHRLQGLNVCQVYRQKSDVGICPRESTEHLGLNSIEGWSNGPPVSSKDREDIQFHRCPIREDVFDEANFADSLTVSLEECLPLWGGL